PRSPADLPLTELTPDNADHDRNLTGIARWPTLEQVTVTGVPHPAELTELAGLPRLRRLTVRRPQPADLNRLTSLPGSCQVDLEDIGAGPLDAVRAALPRRTDRDIQLNGPPRPPGAHRLDPAG